jgi:uncharacterized protein (TIGR00369 family)
MNIKTHQRIDQELCGIPLIVEDGFSQVQLHTRERMAADQSGLVHGGFVFGLADYSAMIAVNHPTVVLGAANVEFLKPVKVPEVIIAEAKVVSKEGKRHRVTVAVRRGGEDVLRGEFVCFVLDKHVLD